MAKKSIRKKPYAFTFLSYDQIKLSSFYFAGTQATGTNVNSLCCAVNFALNFLDVGIPNMIGSSMRMAYVVTKMNALATYCTFSHLCTS